MVFFSTSICIAVSTDVCFLPPVRVWGSRECSSARKLMRSATTDLRILPIAIKQRYGSVRLGLGVVVFSLLV